ncbi:MAG: hypothetical protein GWP10_20190 [Nitrospiraceae bacterium]|nr:hypothetical protein [Nitrospiraceae bacterium]
MEKKIHKFQIDKEEQKKREERRNFFNNCMECDADIFNSVVMDNGFNTNNKYWTFWIDILGFKKLVENKKYEEIFDMLSFLSNYNHEKFKSESLIASLGFSDTVINVYDSHSTSFDLFFLLLNIGMLQLLFIFSFKNLIRGALIFDDLCFLTDSKMSTRYISNNMYFFGKGIIRAYELEKNIFYPVIAVDPIIIQEIINCYKSSYVKALNRYKDPDDFESIKNHFFSPSPSSMKDIMEYLFESDFPVLRKVKIEDKEMYYVDYLSRLSEFENNEMQEFINLHKQLIEIGLKKKDEGIVKKYEFLRNYHNDTVKKLIKLDFLNKHAKQFLI